MSNALPEGADACFDIWPDGAPGGTNEDLHERIMQNPDPSTPERWVYNIAVPTLTRFPAANPNGTAMIVAPGGAFHFVSIDNEGYRVALKAAANGIDCYVLKYRCFPMPDDAPQVSDYLDSLFGSLPAATPGEFEPPRRHRNAELGRELAEEDGRQAIRFMRANADRLGIAGHRLGVMGFSAGGGIAVDLACAAPSECRPDFCAAIYPGYRQTEIPKDAPPIFLATAADDALVAPFSTARLAEKYHRARKQVTLHVYGDGGHGFGIRNQNKLSDRWFDDFRAWLLMLASKPIF